MKFLTQSTVTALILGAFIGAGINSYWQWFSDDTAAPVDGETAVEHAVKHLQPDYVCPMHSDVVAKQAGSCPVCGMDLVKREPAVITTSGADDLPEVKVSAEFMHNFGVRAASVTRGPVSRQIIALGRVSRMPLPKVTEVSSALKGKLISASHKTIGDTVKKGELLYSVDSPEWRELQQNYIDTVSDKDKTENRQLRQRLQALGMKPGVLEQLTENGRIQQIYEVIAPKGGNIVEWHAKKDEQLAAGGKVVTLGGVNRVPIIVSLFEGQGAWVRRGQKIKVRVPTLPGVEYQGQIDRTDREINFSTRTLPVYAGFTTTDARIRYGMLVEVTIEAAARENILRIPREALIRTGEGNRVIVARGDGRFLPVWVKPGIESGDYIEVLSGLKEGQKVVVSGQFLIDSESSLKADFQRMDMADENQ